MTDLGERASSRSPLRPHPAGPDSRSGVSIVALAATAVVLLRLPFADAAPGADEAGFLMVARQWRAGGGSLYGSLWVDRPPLLVSIFRIAAQLGGLVPLRVIGALAASLVVVGTARVAGQVVRARPTSGPGSISLAARASAVAALIAAALCVSPLMGALEVNGELLAAPFVVWGISAFLAALDPGHAPVARAARVMAAGAGLAGAVLVKQNFVDVGVFTSTALALAVIRHEMPLGRAVRLCVGFALGAVTATSIVAGWTVLHGTSLKAVYEAMYPFRLAAARAMASSGNTAPGTRLTHLVAELVLSAVPLLVLTSATALARRRMRDTAIWALIALLAFDVVSILAGGNYWSHYLMQLVVPVSILGGVVAASVATPGLVATCRLGIAAVVVSGAIAWTVGAPGPASEGSSLGTAVRAASASGDTIITIYGHADVSESSGLSSPYPYLWSLPLKVRDPHEQLLVQVVSGPEAPTWLVTWAGVGSIGVDASGLQQVLDQDYHRVAVLGGHTVYLRDGTDRSAPTLTR